MYFADLPKGPISVMLEALQTGEHVSQIMQGLNITQSMHAGITDGGKHETVRLH